MKKFNLVATTLVTLALTCAGAAQVSAAAKQNGQNVTKSRQTQHQEMMTPDAMMEHLSTQLDLTASQKVKIRPIVEEVSQHMEQLRQDTSISEQDRRQRMKEVHENAISEVKPLLTPEQQNKLDQMMASHSQQGNKGQSGEGQEQSANSSPHR